MRRKTTLQRGSLRVQYGSTAEGTAGLSRVIAKMHDGRVTKTLYGPWRRDVEDSKQEVYEAIRGRIPVQRA